MSRIVAAAHGLLTLFLPRMLESGARAFAVCAALEELGGLAVLLTLVGLVGVVIGSSLTCAWFSLAGWVWPLFRDGDVAGARGRRDRRSGLPRGPFGLEFRAGISGSCSNGPQNEFNDQGFGEVFEAPNL